MVVEDEITSGGKFDADTLEVLHKLSNFSPKSSYNGTLDKIEVFYHGDKEDMSGTLRKLADASDKRLSLECKSSGKPVVTGAVNEEYRVSGTPLSLDRAEIRFYITIVTGVSPGD
jgi:hypothetical protein